MYVLLIFMSIFNNSFLFTPFLFIFYFSFFWGNMQGYSTNVFLQFSLKIIHSHVAVDIACGDQVSIECRQENKPLWHLKFCMDIFTVSFTLRKLPATENRSFLSENARACIRQV